jgi:2-C-methyl-D-erythritol 4-phosphate cytidylyltransferase
MATHVILGGGGSGKRMHSRTNKSFILLDGKPIITYSLKLFQNHPKINDIIIVMHPDWIKEIMIWVNQLGITKVKHVIAGGKERQDSIRMGLDTLKNLNPKQEDIVLIHNTVNPLVTEEMVSECILAAELHQASVIGYPVKDTIRRVSESGKSIETLNRNELWGMQTPQCIQYELFRKAHEKAFKEGFYGTDDVQLVERMGVQPLVVDGGYENIKITTPEDIKIAEQILQKRKEKSEEEDH